MVVGLSTGARPIFFDGERLNMLPTAVYIPTLPPVASVPIPSRASLLQPLSLYILQTSSN
jgi:hypothetical protein